MIMTTSPATPSLPLVAPSPIEHPAAFAVGFVGVFGVVAGGGSSAVVSMQTAGSPVPHANPSGHGCASSQTRVQYPPVAVFTQRPLKHCSSPEHASPTGIDHSGFTVVPSVHAGGAYVPIPDARATVSFSHCRQLYTSP